jgi:serine/threonine protein phosphatase PrpC
MSEPTKVLSGLFEVRVWSKSVPSRSHPERNEDLAWSAANGVAHAVIDGMGGSRRVVNGREVGGEHAAGILGEALSKRLQELPQDLQVTTARELLSIVVAEAGERIFTEVNSSGEIPPEQITEGKTAEDMMAAAVMTAVIICDGGRRAVIGQNGDTRAYLFSGDELILLTEDQDAVQLDVEHGALAAEEAARIQDAVDNFDGHDIGKLDPRARKYFLQRNLVYGHIGDTVPPPPPAFSTIQLRPGDMLVLVSDGVYSNLTTSEIANSLASIDPAATLVDRGDARSGERTLPDPADLTMPYNYRAHQDDTTAVVVKIEW